jgi:hypothetical protein
MWEILSLISGLYAGYLLSKRLLPSQKTIRITQPSDDGKQEPVLTVHPEEEVSYLKINRMVDKYNNNPCCTPEIWIALEPMNDVEKEHFLNIVKTNKPKPHWLNLDDDELGIIHVSLIRNARDVEKDEHLTTLHRLINRVTKMGLGFKN